MQYRPDRYQNPLSILGYGCMRFPMKRGKIDMQKTEELVLTAINRGINYFDTAYIYPGSEAALGEILEKNRLRDRVHIATKLPHYLLKNAEGLEKLFQEELRRLRTDHIDYYLMHMLTDPKTWARLQALGIEEWLRLKKESGAIRQIGFSYHGNSDCFCRLVDLYDWDFCMIQYNYMDEHSQAGKRGLTYAHQKGLPVMIMEPLRGGRLVNHLPEAAKSIFTHHPVQHTPAQWALRWLWNQEAVTCVLSGMSNQDVLTENLRAASEAQANSLTEADHAMLARVKSAINAKIKVGCTGCGYCTPCPQQVDIPGAFSAYNRRYAEGWFSGMKDYVMCTALRPASTAASNCIGCGKCEKHCPQQIQIRKELKNVQKTLESPIYHLARKVICLFRHY